MDANVKEFVESAIKWFAKEVRNRDAHEYVPERRDKDFPDVELRFVPALNHVLNCIGKDKVRLEVERHQTNKSWISHT